MRHIVFIAAILAMLTMSSGVAIYGLTHMPPEKVAENLQLGSISEVNQVSRNEVRLTLGPGTIGADFDRCRIMVLSPNNADMNLVSLETNEWTYMIKGERLTLTTIILIDNAFDSRLDSGDIISLFHVEPLEKGAWTLWIYLDDDTLPSLTEVFVVPDLLVTPMGAFRNPSSISETEFLLPFGIINEKVPFYHTALHITSPSGIEVIWTFGQVKPYLLAYNDTVWISIIDMAEQRIINFDDLVRVQSTDGPLQAGLWQFELEYVFTTENISEAAIDVTVQGVSLE